MTDHSTKIKSDIEKYGVHIVHVLDEDDEPNFSYTIGLFEKYQKPEIIIIGQSQDLHQVLLNNIAYDYNEGRILTAGKLEDNILDDYKCMIVEVDKENYEEFLGIAMDYYNSMDFPVMQIIWPTQAGVFPYDKEAPADFKSWQPILGKINP
jgi:hypothetical protein